VRSGSRAAGWRPLPLAAGLPGVGASVGALSSGARIAGVKRYRRLRRLVADAELVRRRAAGESLRALAADYGVAHTTLGRYFARPDVARQLREQTRLLRAEQRAERAAERKLVQEVRRQARRQAALERAQARDLAALRARIARRRPAVRSAQARWLDERELARPLVRAELHSQSDEIAAQIVARGGGIEAIVDATDLRTRENVLRLIDPAILVRAFRNDAAAAAAEPSRAGLRHLRPDPALLHRRAAGETLRALAPDYNVAHTTLARYLKRPDAARQLAAASRKHRKTPA
jgi:lambda repressor-like predicted transcriptional regulator